MAGTALDVEHLLNPDNLAGQISIKWMDWYRLRDSWMSEKTELRNYIFATDTKTTTNQTLDWSNSTTTPKLTQIYDNLKANYSAALFPNKQWLRWEADDRESGTLEKRNVIQAYMDTKIKQSGFMATANRLIDDYVLYGNCFATVDWIEDVVTDDLGGQVVKYIGPRMRRISPFDIVFNPTAADFVNTPKITREVVMLGELQRSLDEGKNPEYQAIFTKMLGNRQSVAGSTSQEKSEAYVADGFSNIENYYGSDYVELLTFHGDIYDTNEGILKTNRKIVVADRAYIVSDEPIASWLGTAPIAHAGWRNRPDNLYAMGPLDNLVGMQYRIDHLENLKADVFDQIALPMLKVHGDVEKFTNKPGEKIFVGVDGDVSYLHPPATALNADFQIQALEVKMEELAGAPRAAMGIRTPGEKTAFEVGALERGMGRIFQHKAEQVERDFYMVIVNIMLESARRNMDKMDTIRSLDSATGLMLFEDITKEDVVGNGKIVPVGASHFAERAQRVQNLQQLMSFSEIPSVAPHLSGLVTAELLADELGELRLFGENIAIAEQLKTQQAAQDAEAQNMEDLEIAAEIGA